MTLMFAIYFMPRPKQPQTRKILSSSLTIFGLLIILSLISWAVFNNLSKQKTVNSQTQKLEQEIQELEQQNLELASLINYFFSDEYVEKEAREKLNLAQPGEKVIIIPEEKANNDLNADFNTDRDINKKSSLGRWWQYFFSKTHE